MKHHISILLLVGLYFPLAPVSDVYGMTTKHNTNENGNYQSVLQSNSRDEICILRVTSDDHYLFSANNKVKLTNRDGKQVRLPMNNMVLLWDLETDKIIRKFPNETIGPKEGVQNIIPEPNTTHALFVFDNTIQRVSYVNGEILQKLEVDTKITASELVFDGQYLIIATYKDTRIYNAHDLSLINTTIPTKGYYNGYSSHYFISIQAFSHSRRVLLSEAASELHPLTSFHILDLTEPDIKTTEVLLPEMTTKVILSHDDNYFLLVKVNEKERYKNARDIQMVAFQDLIIWSGGGAPLKTQMIFIGYKNEYKYTRIENLLLSNNNQDVWIDNGYFLVAGNLATKQKSFFEQHLKSDIKSMCLSESNERLFVGMETGEIKIWDTRTKEFLRTLDPPLPMTLRFAPTIDGRYLWVHNAYRTLYRWDIQHLTIDKIFHNIKSFGSDPRKNTIWIQNFDLEVQWLDAVSCDTIPTLGKYKYSKDFAYNHGYPRDDDAYYFPEFNYTYDGTKLVTTWLSDIHIYNLNDFTEYRTIDDLSQKDKKMSWVSDPFPQYIEISRDNRYMITAATRRYTVDKNEYLVHIWDLETNTMIGKYEYKETEKNLGAGWSSSRHQIEQIGIDPTGQYAFAKNVDQLLLFKLKNGKKIKTIDIDKFRHGAEFSADGNTIFIKDEKGMLAWDLKGRPVSPDMVQIEAITPTERQFQANPDGSISMTNDALQVTFIADTTARQWLVLDNEGYWDATSNGGNLIAMAAGLNVWNIDQFAVVNNRPDILLSKLHADDPSLITHYKRQYQKRLRRMGIANADDILADNFPYVDGIEVINENGIAKVHFSIHDDRVELKNYNIFVNDVPVFGAAGKPVQETSRTISEQIELTHGLNKIEISCTNEDGIESFRSPRYIYDEKEVCPDLYMLAFGVSEYSDPSLNLNYAHKDAMDLGQAVKSLKGKGFTNVYTRVLTNKQVTPEAIETAKDFTRNARPDDTFILFIAGHGMYDVDADATYYFLTHNVDLSNLSETAINFESIENLLQGIPPRNKLFLLDACESGEYDEEEYTTYASASLDAGVSSRGMKRNRTKSAQVTASTPPPRNYLHQKDRYIYNDLIRRSGAIVFSSSRGGELSYERSDIQNGLFTENIIKALTSSAADADSSGVVSTDELRSFVLENVEEMSKGLQHPTVDRNNIYQKFGFQIRK